MITMTDGRGGQSTTLAFVVISWFAVLVKFIVAGINLGVLGVAPPMSATDFGIAVTGILAIWVGREAFAKSAVGK